MTCLCVPLLAAQARTTVVLLTADSGKQGFGTELYHQALNKAAEAKVWQTSEFDVRLTADGVVVVNHDDVIEGRLRRRHHWLKDDLKTARRCLRWPTIWARKKLPKRYADSKSSLTRQGTGRSDCRVGCQDGERNTAWRNRWNISRSA